MSKRPLPTDSVGLSPLSKMKNLDGHSETRNSHRKTSERPKAEPYSSKKSILSNDSIMNGLKVEETTSDPGLDSDLFCGICFDFYCEAHMTRCGHTFCHECLEKSLRERPVCPKCSQQLGPNDYFPNHALNDIIRKRKQKKQVPDGVSIQELLAGSPAANLENIQINSISSLIEALQEKKMEMENQQEKIQNQVLHRFLSKMRDMKSQEMEVLRRQLDTVESDLKQAERRIRDHSDHAIVPDNSIANDIPALMGSKAAERKKRLDHHFQDLSKTYLDRRCAISSQFKFDDFSNTVAKFTQYESLQAEATLYYSTELFQTTSIVSSIDFDCDADYFAVAGVTKKDKNLRL